jgi:hypothetical protein
MSNESERTRSSQQRSAAGTRVRALIVCLALTGISARASAEPEPLDKTRLDVERLPVEAIAPTRDMFAVGFHVRAELGGQGFVGGIGRISRPGPFALLAAGYEFTPWFGLALEFGLGMHATHAPAPPAATAFQIYTGLVQARLQLPLSTRVALWLAGDAGVGWASGDFLQAYGYRRAADLGLVYGGSLGFDWHFMNRHHSIGLRAGAHLFPELAAPNAEKSLSIEAAAYLKYVF